MLEYALEALEKYGALGRVVGWRSNAVTLSFRCISENTSFMTPFPKHQIIGRKILYA
jgi:hypothetical protein